MNTAVPGAILAGGRSRRYGSTKALADVGGERIIDRVIRTMQTLVSPLVLITNSPEVREAVGLPARPDIVQGGGALAGLHSALTWAAEDRLRGVLAVACDMPFLSRPLLERLLEESVGANTEDAPIDVVIPESGGPREVEPLCAWYAVRCLPAIEQALSRGDRSMVSFHDDVHVQRIPLAEVRAYGDPEVMFLNVNTPEDRERADRIARSLT